MLRCLIPVITLLTGCANDCQDLCNNMADWAETECGQTFSKEDVNDCLSTYSNDNVSETQLADCAEYNERIDEEWTCDELDSYFE